MPTSKPIQNFRDGVLVSTTPYLEPDEITRQHNALVRLQQGRSQLRTIRNQAQSMSDSNAVLTLTQLINQTRQLASAVAILSQTIMDIEFIASYNQDDGLE